MDDADLLSKSFSSTGIPKLTALLCRIADKCLQCKGGCTCTMIFDFHNGKRPINIATVSMIHLAYF